MTHANRAGQSRNEEKRGEMGAGPVVCIERTSPRGGIPEHPVWKNRHGFVLGDPKHGDTKHGDTKHHERNEIYVQTLNEVAVFVSKGFSVRMGRHGVPASLVSPEGLRIAHAVISNQGTTVASPDVTTADAADILGGKGNGASDA